MKKITYNERAKFYNFEVKKNLDLLNFLEILKNKLNINTTVLIPCGAGIYSNYFSQTFQLNYFFDCEPSMIKELKLNLSSNNIRNVIPCIKNLKEPFEQSVDAVFVLDQGIQFLNFKELTNFLTSQIKYCKYIIIDMYDFFSYSDDSLEYYDVNKKENYREFQFSEKLYERKISYIKDTLGITFNYVYRNNNKDIYSSNLYLYNYSFNQIISLIESIGNIRINSIYKNYLFEPYSDNNRFILVLEVIK